MGIAVPIVGAAVGVASTVNSISQQNAQVRAQNAAISSQISANEQQEQIRRMQADVQRQIIRDQYQVDKIARQTSFQEERQNLRSLARQSRTQQRAQITGLNLQEQESQLQTDAAQAQIDASLAQTGQFTDENTIATLNSLSQALGQIENPTPRLEELSRQVESATAEVLATAGGQGRSSNIARGPNDQLIQETLEAISRGQTISAEVAQELVRTEEFNNIIRQIANTQAGLETAIINQRNQATGENIQLAREGARLEGRAFRQQTRGAQRMNRLTRRIGNEQARTNRAVSEANLITGLALGEAQTAASTAQLSSQRVSGTGAIGTIAGLTQTLAPLAGLIGTSSSSTQQQPQFGITTNRSLSNLTSPTRQSTFRVPRQGVITDVTGNIFA